MQRRTLQPMALTLLFCLLPWIVGSHPSWIASPAFVLFLKPLPFLLLMGLAFLGAKLNQVRLVYVALFLTVAYLYLQIPAPPAFLAARPAYRTQAVGLSVPLVFSLLFLLPEGRLGSAKGISLVAATLLPILLISYGLHVGWPWLHRLAGWEALGRGGKLRLPETTVLFAAAFAVAAFGHRNPSRRLLHVFLALSLVPLFGALNYRAPEPLPPVADGITALAFALQGIVLVYAVFLLYWEKVYLDELTAIPNRRALNEQLPRLGRRFSVAMVDIDHFKRFNDTYGHEEGDHVLRYVGAHLDQYTGGRAYRYGGEEFTVLFDGDGMDRAARTMELVRKTLADRPFVIRATRGSRPKAPGVGGKRVPVTVSVGVACSDGGRKPDQALLSADEALYQAKGKGRNCVVLAGDKSPGHRAKHK